MDRGAVDELGKQGGEHQAEAGQLEAAERVMCGAGNSTSRGKVMEDVPLVVELHHGGPVGELFQAGEAATSGAAVATVA
jgi:hypothetical protein